MSGVANVQPKRADGLLSYHSAAGRLLGAAGKGVACGALFICARPLPRGFFHSSIACRPGSVIVIHTTVTDCRPARVSCGSAVASPFCTNSASSANLNPYASIAASAQPFGARAAARRSAPLHPRQCLPQRLVPPVRAGIRTDDPASTRRPVTREPFCPLMPPHYDEHTVDRVPASHAEGQSADDLLHVKAP
jgi:hypothetical protein